MREVKATLGRIEALMRGFGDRLRRVETDLAELKGKVSQLPTGWTLFTGGTGMVPGISALAFALLLRPAPFRPAAPSVASASLNRK